MKIKDFFKRENKKSANIVRLSDESEKLNKKIPKNKIYVPDLHGETPELMSDDISGEFSNASFKIYINPTKTEFIEMLKGALKTVTTKKVGWAIDMFDNLIMWYGNASIEHIKAIIGITRASEPESKNTKGVKVWTPKIRIGALIGWGYFNTETGVVTVEAGKYVVNRIVHLLQDVRHIRINLITDSQGKAMV